MFQVSVTSRCHLGIDLLWHKPCRANLKKRSDSGFQGFRETRGFPDTRYDVNSRGSMNDWVR